VNEQIVATQGIRTLRGVESVFVIKQKTTILPKVEPIIIKGVHVAIRVKYSEPRHNHQCGSIVKRILRDWRRGIHNVNKVPRFNLPPCTYCHQIGH
jgi:hypothetical protein